MSFRVGDVSKVIENNFKSIGTFYKKNQDSVNGFALLFGAGANGVLAVNAGLNAGKLISGNNKA